MKLHTRIRVTEKIVDGVKEVTYKAEARSFWYSLWWIPARQLLGEMWYEYNFMEECEFDRRIGHTMHYGSLERAQKIIDHTIDIFNQIQENVTKKKAERKSKRTYFIDYP